MISLVYGSRGRHLVKYKHVVYIYYLTELVKSQLLLCSPLSPKQESHQSLCISVKRNSLFYMICSKDFSPSAYAYNMVARVDWKYIVAFQ
jgi:hypothetical protein